MSEFSKIHGIYKRYLEGKNKGKFIMGDYSLPEFELLKNIKWTWTEKVDGTNIRIYWLRCPNIARIDIKGKTDKAEIPKHLLEYLNNTFSSESMKQKLLSLFELSEEKPDVCFYGEGYGYKIQNGGKYFLNPQEVGFVLFDIKIGSHYLSREDIEVIAKTLELPIVPIINTGTIDEAISYIKTNPISTFGNKDFVMEGVVLKPKYDLLDRRGHRIVTKIKVCDFKGD
jgi:hypothetical protein